MIFSLAASMTPAAAADAPTNVSGVALGQTALRVSWDAGTAPQHYQVKYGTKPDVYGGTLLTPVTGTSRQISGLRGGTRYYFKVRVTDSAGTAQSGWSAIASASTKPLMKIAVASYNIKDPDSDSLGSWDVRGPRSAAAIVGQGVKLLGVQEVFEDNDRHDMLRFINAKAGGPHYSMVPEPDSDDGEDSRIIFDTRVLRHIASGGFSFATQNGSEDRALAWGKFQHRASGRYIVFVTTHLSPRSDSVDVAQWKQLISWANKVRSANPTYKFIITGDFNTTKFEPPATMLAAMRSNGYEDILGQIRNSYSTYRNPSVRVDAWISSSNRGEKDLRDCGCLVSTDKNSNSIDYVFVSKALKATYYRVYAQPRTGHVMKYLMSDHFMVRATISQ
jgi:endonuclease/exonuclease/phosphatase family metal-dependent hydrolase